MSKLSIDLRVLIDAKSRTIERWPLAKFEIVMDKIKEEATERGLDRNPWLAIIMATTMTSGSSESITAVAQHLMRTLPLSDTLAAVEFAREVGLICMAMNGAPQTITLLTAFCGSFPPDVRAALRKTPSRHMNAALTALRGRTLWEQIHLPFAGKLARKFGQAHPDLPSLVVKNIYGDLFSSSVCKRDETIGRVTTSLSAIACLRARPGFAVQVFDHVCGLKNAWRDDSWKSEPHIGSQDAVEWLLSDEGCMWVPRKVDELIAALVSTTDSKSAGCRAKL